MLSIAAKFSREMDNIIKFIELNESSFALAKSDLKKFHSKHAIATSARVVHANARAIPLGIGLACEGAYLTGCARYEEALRNLIEEAVVQLQSRVLIYENLSEKMKDAHQNGCAEIIQNIKHDKFKHLSPLAIVTNLMLCLKSTKASKAPYMLIVEAFSSNERNFKPKIIAEHFTRLGLKSLWPEIGKDAQLKTFLKTSTDEDTRNIAEAQLESIMDKRNLIMHRGRGLATPSTTEVIDGVRFLVELIGVLARLLDSYVAKH